MLAVHWSPVKNTSNILKNGITKSKRGLFCFPMTGVPNVDKWWANVFHRHWRPRTNYNGFVFRVVKDDLPVSFGDWAMDQKKHIKSVSQLGEVYRKLIAIRIFQFVSDDFQSLSVRTDAGMTGIKFLIPPEWGDELETYAEKILTEAPHDLVEMLKRDPAFMTYVFENYQLILSRSIAPERIIRVISANGDSGRDRVRKNRRKQKLED